MKIKVGDMVRVRRTALVQDELVEQEAKERARVMAIAEGCAMVRYKRCMPFVLYMKDLQLWNAV
jgi:hypothetical protein